MTQANAPIPLANQHIWPYTEMLLHDMGENLADNVSEFAATGAFWRTAPLWGLSHAKNPQQRSLLHDGRARTIQEAILWHGGEAEQVKQHYMRLPRSQRQQLLRFIETR
jgi:CxxC motif-containing protein (DUF1111 family)